MRHAALFAVYLLPLVAFCGSVQVTDDMRAMCAALARVIQRCGLTLDQAARYMGINKSLLSRQLLLRDGAHPSFARMGLLPKRAKRFLAMELCDMEGESRVVADEKLDAILRHLDTAVTEAERKLA